VYYQLNLGTKYCLDSLRIVDKSNSFKTRFLNTIFKTTVSKNSDIDYSSLINLVKFTDYIELEKTPDFSIIDTFAILNLYIKERKLNQFNATIGILSNAYESNKVQLTGDVSLSLQNILNRGISINLNWQKNLTNSQFLYLKSNVPYLFNTQFGWTNQFSIEKFDTVYQRIQNQIGIDYYISSNNSISFIYKYQSSAIDGLDISKLVFGLPSSLDYTFQQFGFGYKLSRLDRPIFPKSGIKIEANILFGKKSISKNNKILSAIDANGLSYDRLYDTIKLTQTMTSFQFNISNYASITNDFILKSTIDSKGLIVANIGINEMYYIGGNRLPRGFDDNSIPSPNYLILSNDLQYYLSEYFYSNIFADISIMQNSLALDKISIPIGFGFGISFKTSSNIFQLNIGTSKSENNPISISNSKVHIQYTNVF
jgi:hypothetical protein